MWNKLKDSNLYIRSDIKDNKYNVYVTDYVNIWYVYYTETEFLKCLQASNRALEMSDKDFIYKGTSVLMNPEGIKSYEVEPADDTLHVNTVTMVNGGCPLRINLKLCTGSKELVVTQPLLVCVDDLRSSENRLYKLLQKRDKKIEYVKDNFHDGEKIIKCLRTVPPFDYEGHQSKHCEYECMFHGSASFPNELLDKVLDLPEATLKEDICKLEVPIKEEPVSTNIIEEFKREPPESGSTVKTEVNTNLETAQEIVTETVKAEMQDIKPVVNTTEIPRKRKKLKY